MSERKVINKYISPDFDPAKIQRTKRKGGHGPRHQTVRLMAPFSMRCTSCGEFIYKGRKFNARKEDTQERYYTVKIYRFHIRCTRCSSDITFRTDPKNADYAAETGAQRNFEPWREAKAAEDDDETELDKLEEEENAMEALESKTIDAKREMEIADALDEIRTRNAMGQRLGPDALLAKLEESRQLEAKQAQQEAAELSTREVLEQDKEQAKAIFSSEQGQQIRRLQKDAETMPAPAVKFAPVVAPKRQRGSMLGVKVAKKVKLI